MEEDYNPKPRLYYGARHVPLIVTPVESNRRPGQVVAFIGKQLCFFERGSVMPEVGKPIEVMITRPLHARLGPNDTGPVPIQRDDGSMQYGINYNKLTALLIEPVDPQKHLLVAIDGFECSGTMCRTTAHGVVTYGRRPWTPDEVYPKQRKDRVIRSQSVNEPTRMWLTPGRSQIREANNVNAGKTWKTPYKELMPTNVYVERAVYEEVHGCGVRVAGLTRVEDCSYARLIRQ